MSYCTPDDVNFQSGVIRLFDRALSCTGHPDEPQNRGGTKLLVFTFKLQNYRSYRDFTFTLY